MAYVALYRKWRPLNFDQVVEQDSVIRVLKNTIISERIAHAYLFCGTRGTGKTTIAKIFARAVNCLNPHDGNPCNECEICKSILSQQTLDVSEIDAASNNGVENIRSIIEDSAYASSIAKYKVFIIDEVHMLSSGAFNALLKTLEEPPINVIFILATTEPNKLPVTILSRCQRYDFKRISQEGIISRLEEICKSQGIQYELPALAFLAQKSDGAMRDAISLLDQTLAGNPNSISLSDARASTGSIDKRFLEDFAYNIIIGNGSEILKQVAIVFSEGRDISDFLSELMQIYRNVLVLLSVKNHAGLLYETSDSLEKLKEISKATNKSELSLIIKELSSLDASLKWALQRKILFETGMLNLCDRKWDTSKAELEQRIDALEKRLSDLVESGIRISLNNSNNTLSASTTNSIEQINNDDNNKFDVKKYGEDIINKDAIEESDVLEASKQPLFFETDLSTEEDDIFHDDSLEKNPFVEEKKKAPVEIKKEAPAKISNADELDWRDFLSEVTSKGQQSLSNLLKANTKGMLDGKGNLILVFSSPIVKEMIVKKDAIDILSESATRAFGVPLRVVYASKNDDLSAFTSSEIDEAQKDSFEESVNILKELSQQDGFSINMN